MFELVILLTDFVDTNGQLFEFVYCGYVVLSVVWCIFSNLRPQTSSLMFVSLLTGFNRY